MNTQINESTLSLEHFVQKKEQQQTEKGYVHQKSQENLAMQKDIHEILQRLKELEMRIDTMMDVR